MKKFVICIALFGLVGLTACTNESPTPKPVPTVVPDEWSVATLTVSDPAPLVGATVQVQALIYNNGAQADNGTTVTFTASGGAFGDGSTETTADTQSGRALVLFSANEAGNYVIDAQVQTASKSVNVAYQGLGGDALQIYQPLVPNAGSFDGGETVMLRGKGIMGPVEVTFTVEGIPYPAIVQEVEESNPLSADGEITVTSPFISAGNTNQNQPADVQVKGGVGTASEQTVNMVAAFTYLANAGGGEPIIYALDPDYGRSEGGDQVVVLGSDLNDATRFEFGFRGQQLQAQILTVSQDGQQMAIMTPRFSATPLDAPETASATVTTPASTFTLNEAFIVVADDPQPELASLSPIAGPLDGGTLVSVFGSGFKMPVQVTFGGLAATDVNLVDDQSPADNDMITCLSPNYSQQGQQPPVVVDVQVTNMTSGKQSNTLPFTYGDNLFISGNSPTEGERGDVVLVFGSGFEDPLQLFFTGNNREVEVQSVSGTEISARIPLEWPVDCADRPGAFSVTLIESNQTITGGDFTLLGNTPTVTDVEPTFVQSYNDGDGVTPNDVVITGAEFAEDVLVKINDYVLSPSDVTVVNETTIEADNIPAPNNFGLQFDTSDCTTVDGDPGRRQVPSPVRVTVVNLPGNCESSLEGALIYEPEDTTCVAMPILNVEPRSFDFGTVPEANGGIDIGDVTIFNEGGAAMDWTASSTSDQIWLSSMSGNIPPNSSAVFDVFLNPYIANADFNEVITVSATDPLALGSPIDITVTGVIEAP